MNEQTANPRVPEWYRLRPGEEEDPVAARLPLRDSLRAYVERGIPAGSFVQSVIWGDLYDAAQQADAENRHWLWHYAHWFYTYAPAACYGRPSIYHTWIAMHKNTRCWDNHPPELGQRVQALLGFSGVPANTQGVINKLHDDGGVFVAWDLPEHPLPAGYMRHDGTPGIRGGIVRNRLWFEDLRFLVRVDKDG